MESERASNLTRSRSTGAALVVEGVGFAWELHEWSRRKYLPCCHHAKQHSAHAPRLFFDTG
jgi:hypothetical protein